MSEKVDNDDNNMQRHVDESHAAIHARIEGVSAHARELEGISMRHVEIQGEIQSKVHSNFGHAEDRHGKRCDVPRPLQI